MAIHLPLKQAISPLMQLGRNHRFSIDWRLLLFFILLILLPFIVFSKPVTPMLATDPQFEVSAMPDILDEDFVAFYSSLTIALTSVPADTVFIVAYPGTQLNIAGGYLLNDTLMFTPSEAAFTAKEIKVKPWDDAIFEGLHSGTITFAVISDDPLFGGGTIDAVSYTIHDNELPFGVNTVFITDTVLQEGLPGVPLLFSMGTIPEDSVYITIDPDDQMRITGIPGEAITLVFAPDASALSLDGYNIRAVDDAVFEGPHSGHIVFTVSSADPVYDAFTVPDLIYAIADNDEIPAIYTEIPTDTSLLEGITEIELNFALASQPSDSVYITVDPDMQLRITGFAGEAITLVFPPNATSTEWHPVYFRAADDMVFEGPHTGTMQFTVTSTDAVYAAMGIEDVTYSIIDNDDPPGLNVNIPAVLELSEGLFEELPVVISLQSVPTDTVKIYVHPDEQVRVTEPGVAVALVFPPNTSALNDHVANIKVYDDILFEGTHTGTVFFTMETTDPDYVALSIPDLSITVFDNELEPNVIFSDTSGFAGTEGDSILFFTVQFGSIPLSTMTMTLQPDIQLNLGKGPGDEVKLKFRGDSALIEKVVDVFITEDYSVEGAHFGYITITLTGDDPGYAAWDLRTIRVAITDDDGLSIVAEDPDMFQVYPNLIQDQFQYILATPADIQVFTVSGTRLQTIPAGALSGTIDASAWPAGRYFLMAEQNGIPYLTECVKY